MASKKKNKKNGKRKPQKIPFIKCPRCGQYGKKSGHHIFPYRYWGKDRNSELSKKLFKMYGKEVLENKKPICFSCHVELEKWIGRIEGLHPKEQLPLTYQMYRMIFECFILSHPHGASVS